MIYGGFGNDIMAGGGGNDQVFGDEGDDRFGEPAVRDAAANDPGNDQSSSAVEVPMSSFGIRVTATHLVEGGAGDSDQIQSLRQCRGGTVLRVRRNLDVQSALARLPRSSGDRHRRVRHRTSQRDLERRDRYRDDRRRSDTGALSDLSTNWRPTG